MNIAILMMQKNETELLGKWIAYHSYLVGRKNLYIYDNGSTDLDVTEQLLKSESNGVHIIRDRSSKSDYENRGKIFCEKIKELDKKQYYDYYMLVDCDEFLAVVDYEGNISCDPMSLRYSLLRYKNSDELLMIDSQYYNSSISPIWFNKQPYRKCFFKRDSISQLDQGFHWGKVTTSEKEIRTNLIHIHFHNKPYNIAKAHAKEKLTGRVENFNLETLRKYNGSGFHLVRFFLENEQSYINGQLSLNHTKSTSLYYKFNELDITWPFLNEILLSRQNINLTGENDGFNKILPVFRGSIDDIAFDSEYIKVKGWGIINHSRPIDNLFLQLGESQYEFSIIERIYREDVNNLLNVKGVTLGFTANLNIFDLTEISPLTTKLSVSSYIESKQKFFQFDMHRKHREFNFSNLSHVLKKNLK